jgi:hypothetical protein
MKIPAPLALALSLALASCGSSSANDLGMSNNDGGTSSNNDAGMTANDGGPTVGCMVTLTGGVSKMLSCSVSAGYDGMKSALVITTANGPTGAPEFGFEADVAGQLASGMYTWSNSTKQAGEVLEMLPAAWECDSSAMKGSSSVTLSSVSTMTTNGQQVVYTAHGSVTATYVSLSGDSDIMASITF